MKNNYLNKIKKLGFFSFRNNKLFTVHCLLFAELCCLLSNFSFSQENKKIDSLLMALKETKRDTVRLMVLNKLATEYINGKGDINNGEKYGGQLSHLADSLIGENEATKEKPINTVCKNTKANIHMVVGLYYHHHSNYGEALKNYLSALKLYEETNYKPGIAVSHNHIGNIYYAEDNLEESMKNHLIALKIRTELGDRQGIANSNSNMGIIFEKQGKYKEALNNQLVALKTNIALKNIRNTGSCLLEIGTVYKDLGNYDEAMKNYSEALGYFEKNHNVFDIVDANYFIGETYYLQGNYSEAKSRLNNALKLSIKNNTKGNTKEIYSTFSKIYRKLNNYPNALKYYKLYVDVKDSILNGESQDKIAELKNTIETNKKEEAEKAEQQKKDAVSEAELRKEKTLLFGFSAGFAIVFCFSLIIIYQNRKIRFQKKRSEDLLLNILPLEVANELREKGKAAAQNYESVTVMFFDFKNFDIIREQLPPEKIVSEINFYFSAFDAIIGKYKVEKIKTYGEVYMCVGGLPITNSTHPVSVLKAAKEIINFMNANTKEKISKGELPFEIRIGIHTGPVVAGIVGVKKFAYDIWGDTVNIAARMEQNSESGKINISGATYELVKNDFNCTHRGKVEAKNKGEIDMYFVD